MSLVKIIYKGLNFSHLDSIWTAASMGDRRRLIVSSPANSGQNNRKLWIDASAPALPSRVICTMTQVNKILKSKKDFKILFNKKRLKDQNDLLIIFFKRSFRRLNKKIKKIKNIC